MDMNGNTILVTGANRGIGRRLAEEFAKRGNRVIATARDPHTLDALTASTDGVVATYALDLGDAEMIARVAARVVADHPALDMVIHNAGIMVEEELRTPDLAIAERTVTTNLLGPIRLTAALLPHLLAQEKATIVTVSSGLAFVPLAATPTYCATKAAIHSWSLSLREQLKDTGVSVVEIIPPGTQTGLMPGHATNPQMMPLEAFIAETMALLEGEPMLQEVAVERVRFLYEATAEGRFDRTFAALNAGSRG